MFYKFVKRTFDIVLSLLALIGLSPVLLIVAIFTAIYNGCPVLFKQLRPGKDGKIFMLYKFRSMSNAKDKNGNLLPDAERITKFGKFIRATSLDELPQLFNILKGDMSIIGPRPRMIEECVFLDENRLDRFSVRPGITGWAQVNGRNSINFDQVVEYDKEYVNKMSFGLDFKIFFKTIGYVFNRNVINKQGTVSNELYGKFLLRTGAITEDEYNEKLTKAKRIIQEYNVSKSFRKHFAMNHKTRELEDLDFEQDFID